VGIRNRHEGSPPPCASFRTDDGILAGVPKLPWPPAAEKLRREVRLDLEGDVAAVHSATVLVRLHRTEGGHVHRWNAMRRFGPVDARFEPHEPPPHEQAAGVTYLSLAVQTSLAEVYQRTRVVNRYAGRPYLTLFQLTRTVQLLDLAGVWPTRAGASQLISSGRHEVSSAWARVLHRAYPQLDGLWYRSSMNAGEPCLALFENAADALPERPLLSRPLADPGLAPALGRMANELGYLLL
jgi:RES domain